MEKHLPGEIGSVDLRLLPTAGMEDLPPQVQRIQGPVALQIIAEMRGDLLLTGNPFLSTGHRITILIKTFSQVQPAKYQETDLNWRWKGCQKPNRIQNQPLNSSQGLYEVSSITNINRRDGRRNN